MKEEINSKIMDGLTFISTEDLPDGGMTMTFDIEDSFKKRFCEMNGFKKFTQKRFEKWIMDAIMHGADLVKEKHNLKDKEE